MFELNPYHEEHWSKLQGSLAKLLGVEQDALAYKIPNSPGAYAKPVCISILQPHPYTPGGTWVVDLARWQMTCSPGCCGMVFSYNAQTLNKPSMGMGRLLLRWRLFLAYVAGYPRIQATTITNWTASIKLLESEGFKEIASFTNSRTQNVVKVYLRELTAADGDWDAKAKEVIDRKTGNGVKAEGKA